MANLLYGIACPAIVKRFESANDLYRDMLSIKEKSEHLYPNDDFQVYHKHCVEAYRRADESKRLLRIIVFYMFCTSALLFAVLLTIRTLDFLNTVMGDPVR